MDALLESHHLGVVESHKGLDKRIFDMLQRRSPRIYYRQCCTRIYRRIFPRWIPTRVIICLTMFTTCWTNYMCRLQMPMLAVPFINLLFYHFGTLFLVFFLQNTMMLYRANTLRFQLTKGGLYVSRTWADGMFFGFIFGWAGDTLRRSQIISIAVLRKGATEFSHFMPGIFHILVSYAGCRLVLANVFLVLALGFNGVASISNLSNNRDSEVV